MLWSLFMEGSSWDKIVCLSFSAHRVRGTMLPSMWTQPWLFRMQRYPQIPVINDMPAFSPSWTSQYFSVSRGLESQQFGVGLSLSNLRIFNFACTAELCHSKEEWWSLGFGSAAFDMWKYMGMVEWKRGEKGGNLKCIVGCFSCCRRDRKDGDSGCSSLSRRQKVFHKQPF